MRLLGSNDNDNTIPFGNYLANLWYVALIEVGYGRKTMPYLFAYDYIDYY